VSLVEMESVSARKGRVSKEKDTCAVRFFGRPGGEGSRGLASTFCMGIFSLLPVYFTR